jgi:hypothetical protein
MYRLVYRNFGDHESLVVSHTVAAGAGAAIRWYELRIANGKPSVFQQGTFAPDATTYRWMPSASIDAAGDIAVGYSAASTKSYASLRAAGRLAGDPPGEMTRTEASLEAGGGTQTLERWGDYSSMDVDPADGCTFWYAGEYLKETGQYNWRTHISSFRLPGCAGTPVGDDFAINASTNSVSIAPGGRTTVSLSTAATSGSAQPLTLSASGLPAHGRVRFTPSPLTVGNTTTATITTAHSTPPGLYTVSLTATGPSTTRAVTVALTVTPLAPGITNSSFEQGFKGWTRAGRTAVITATSGDGKRVARVGSTAPSIGNASLTQSFIVANAASTLLHVSYDSVCPPSQYTDDWATITLTDDTALGSRTLLPPTCDLDGSGWHQVSAGVVVGHQYTLALASHNFDWGIDATYVLFDAATLSAPPTGIVNGSFETGDFTGWSTTGITYVEPAPHSGRYGALAGDTGSTDGDANIAQTFIAPAGTTTLSVWHVIVCHDTIAYDWASIDLQDDTTGVDTTMLAPTCSNLARWTEASAAITPGDAYTITLSNHDDDYPGDATYTTFDDIATL